MQPPAPLVRALSGTAYGFDDPSSVSSDGTHVWVADLSNRVTEIDASTGAVVHQLTAGLYKPNDIS